MFPVGIDVSKNTLDLCMLYDGIKGVSLDIENYCTVSLCFEQAYLSQRCTPALYAVSREFSLIG